MKTVWDLTLMEVKKRLEKGISVIGKDHLAGRNYDQYNEAWDLALARVEDLLDDVFNKFTGEKMLEEFKQKALKLDQMLSTDTKVEPNAVPDLKNGEKPDALKLEPDMVNSPPHYLVGGIQVLDFILAKRMDFLTGQVCKYISRAGFKDLDKELEDLKKAQFYLNRKIAEMEKQEKSKGTEQKEGAT